MTDLTQRPRFYLSLDQVRESQLLTPARLAAVEAEIESRISIPQDPQGRPIENARLADHSPWPRMLYPRMDHESNWDYMRRELLAVVLTEGERQVLDRHALSAAQGKREIAAFAKATKIKDLDYEGGVYWGDTYYPSIDEFYDNTIDDVDKGCPPEYVWAARPQQVITSRMNVADITENEICDRGWEEMSVDDLEGVTELQAALDVFVAANAAIVSYQPDHKTAVLLNWQFARWHRDTEGN